MIKRTFVVVVITNLLISAMPAAHARPDCLDYSNEDLYHRPGVPTRRVIRDCDINNPPSVPSTPPTTRSNGTTLTYFTSDGSNLVDKPILLVEGYDQDNSIGPEVYYDLMPIGFKGWLKSTGRDLVVINFDDYTIDIKILASQFQAALTELNARKTDNHPTAVIGFSAGGLIARWGLKTMENQGIEHDVSVFITYDTPHRGATIPFGIYDGVKDLKDKIPGPWEPPKLKRIWNGLDSPVARQVLIGHRSNFLRELDSLGHPNKLARFAVANGSSIGTNNDLPMHDIVYDYKVHISWFDNEYQTLRQEPHSPCTYPCDPVRNHNYDRSPGSTRESFREYWEALESSDVDLNVYYKNENLAEHTFVNTLSALDIKNFDINAPVTKTMEDYGPFDGYAYSYTNEPHIKFDATFADDEGAIINLWLSKYHVPQASVPDRADKKVNMATVTGAWSEWLERGTNLINWSSVPNATHYEILQKNSSGKYVRLKTSTNTAVRINVGSNSTIAVRACNLDQCGFSTFTTARYQPRGAVRPFRVRR